MRVLAFALLTNWAGPAVAQVADWSGEWDTRWRDGGARIIFEQDGQTVTGRYPLYNGRIEARAVGDELIGRWIEGRRQGGFAFVQSRDGNTFAGRFASGEWWTGIRAAVVPRPEIPVNRSSPMATMRSFLRATNELGPGTMDLLGTAATLIERRGEAVGQINRIDHARLLFEVLDKLTFRLWDLPVDVEGDSVSATLAQVGTDVTFTVDFHKVGQEWFIAVPPIEDLRAKRAELLAARGYVEGDVLDPRELKTPRDTFKTFLSVLADEGAIDNPAYRTLDMREFGEVVRSREAPLLAGYLKQVLDRVGYVTWQEIPDDPNSRRPYVHFQHPAGDIVVAPVETEAGVIWQFTPDTLHNIRAVYAAMDEMPVAPELSAFAGSDPYFGARSFVRQAAPTLLAPLGPLERWQWLALAVAIVVGVALGFIVSNAVVTTSARLDWSDRRHYPAGVASLTWALRALVLGVSLLLCIWIFGLPDPVGTAVTTIGWVLIVIGLVGLIWNAISVAAERYRRREHIPGHRVTLLSLASGVTKVVVLVAGALMLAHVLSIPYQGVIAGLGIGGLAVALAAQPTLQNLLSGFTLYADRPLAVGDFCRFGDKMGTIEHIGMRSTRIRSLDRTLITVPNAEFSNLQLENFAQRDCIWLSTTLQLRYETTPDQLRYALVELRRLLIAHPKVSPDPARVRFAGFGAHSLDIEIFAYVLTPDINEFYAIREDLYLRMMTVVEEAGTQFAVPSAVHYHAEDKGMDAERIRQAEEKVAAWRTDKQLPFPDFDWRDKAEISNTLEYPPEGSMLAEDRDHSERT